MKNLIAAIEVVLVSILSIQCAQVGFVDRASAQRHSRIVSLAPNLTEILFELGAGDHVVGVTNFCKYPPEAQTKEKIGDFINPNLEKIVSLKPDLVLAERWTSTKIVPRLRQMGLNVTETASPKSLAEIYQVIRQVGSTVGKSDRAEALIGKMQTRVRAIQERGNRFPYRPAVYIEIDLPSWTVGRTSFVAEALSLCGAKNIFGDVDRPALQVSKEMVIERNPEIIISFEARAAEIRRRPGWDQIKAVREGKIIDDLRPNLLSHGNHRLVDGMEELQLKLEKLVVRSSSSVVRGPLSVVNPDYLQMFTAEAQRAQR
ncbi:MAG TPA: ABC transporter substrate-binding protein [Acidobacteriota bacterium]|nr:ABC transporter substrate-binding protein [Acidobacteriota bacterium]